MIRPSPEILAVADRWFAAVRKRDAATMRNLHSASEHLTYLGSADGELWTGAGIRDALIDHFREAPRFVRTETQLSKAYECGAVGWSLHLHRIWFEGRDTPADFRITFVWALEEGSWRIVQRHASVGTPNIDLHGGEHHALSRLVEAAQRGAPLDQREGLASVMFTDIVGSSVLAGALGDQAWSARMSAHFSTLRETVESHGGQFVKSLGDGTMSSFPSARQALRAGLAIQGQIRAQTDEPRLSLRIGIHTGDVVQTRDDFFGTVVNKAARITGEADAGTILVSDVTRAMVGDSPGFAFSPIDARPLKGLGGTHLLFRLEPAP